MHAKATVNGTIIAETDHFEFVEGNVYFPADAFTGRGDTLKATSRTTHCPWKGDSTYYDLRVGGVTLEHAAWSYEQPFEKAKHIKSHVAFDKSKVDVEKS